MRKQRARQIVESALASLKSDEDEQPCVERAGVDLLARADAKRKENDEAWNTAALAGELGPLNRFFAEGRTIDSDPEGFGKALRAAAAEKKAKAEQERVEQEQDEAENNLRRARLLNPDGNVTASRTTKVRDDTAARIISEFEAAYAAGERVTGAAVAQRCGVSTATVSVVRNRFLQACLDENRPAPLWAVSNWRRNAARRTVA